MLKDPKLSKTNTRHNSQFHYIILSDFFGDLQNYIFLERLLSKESENQCCHLPRCLWRPYWKLQNGHHEMYVFFISWLLNKIEHCF